MGLVVGGNYEWCLVIVVIFMGFGGASKKVGDALKSSFGLAMAVTMMGAVFMGDGWSSAVSLIKLPAGISDSSFVLDSL